MSGEVGSVMVSILKITIKSLQAPTHWRSSVQDADPNPEFVDVWLNSFDAISPWTIGRYSTEDEADRFAEEKMKRDMDLIKNANEKSGGVKKIDYIPG